MYELKDIFRRSTIKDFVTEAYLETESEEGLSGLEEAIPVFEKLMDELSDLYSFVNTAPVLNRSSYEDWEPRDDARQKKFVASLKNAIAATGRKVSQFGKGRYIHPDNKDAIMYLNRILLRTLDSIEDYAKKEAMVSFLDSVGFHRLSHKTDLKSQLIKLGAINPELRPHIRKILAKRTYSEYMKEKLLRGPVRYPTDSALLDAGNSMSSAAFDALDDAYYRLSLLVKVPNASARKELISLGFARDPRNPQYAPHILELTQEGRDVSIMLMG